MLKESLEPIIDISDVTDTILLGHVLRQLKRLPDKSVQLVITSPPYYGKMWYKTEPVVWLLPENTKYIEQCEEEGHRWEKGKRTLSYGKSKSSTIRSDGEKWEEQREVIEYAHCARCQAWKGELGQEPNYWNFVDHLYQIFMEVYRVLKDDGIFFLNIGDSFCGSGGWGKKTLKKKGDTIEDATDQARFPTILTDQDYQDKCMMLVPERIVMKLVDKGNWILRNKIVWHIRNKKPESCRDRFSQKYEPIFMFTKKKNYSSSLDAVKIPSETFIKDKRSRIGERIEYDGKSVKTSTYLPSQQFANPGDVWDFTTANLSLSHFATYPIPLIERMVLFGSKEGQLVLDPFMGSGTTAIAAKKLGRHYLGIELNPDFIHIAKQRFASKGNLQSMHGKNVSKLFKKKKKKNKRKKDKYCCNSCGVSFNKPREIVREIGGKEYDMNVCPNCETHGYERCE